MTRTAVSVVLLSDTHGYLDPRIAQLIDDRDIVVHAGDVGCGEVLRALEQRAATVVAVAGNNDTAGKWPRDESDLVATLPRETALQLCGRELVVIHGHQHGSASSRHDWLRRRYPQAKAIVYGHSHRLVIDRQREPWVLNPGAAGRARTYGGPSCLLLRAHAHAWQIECHRFSPLDSRATRSSGNR